MFFLLDNWVVAHQYLQLGSVTQWKHLPLMKCNSKMVYLLIFLFTYCVMSIKNVLHNSNCIISITRRCKSIAFEDENAIYAKIKKSSTKVVEW